MQWMERITRMCLAIPGIVESVEGRRASVNFGGVRREVMLDLMEEGSVTPGTYVIVHTGFVIQTLDKEEAERTLEIWREILLNMEIK
jgi:hydrogenase expression/formation protein HypC